MYLAEICIHTNTLYITIIVVFLTAFVLSSKIHNGDDTHKDFRQKL